ncbi:hypothetical protein EV363DRAFT_1395331 [Boletus edulis]|nr:hypothetical protein EV363DRAFT_1395331 [Boletus edulis]
MPEEQVLGACFYHAKYYKISKRNIELTEVSKHQDSPLITMIKLGTRSQHSNCIPLLGEPRAPTLDNIMKEISLVLQHTIRGSSYQFAETLCNEYLESGDYSNIDSTVTAVTQLESRLHTFRLALPQGNEGADIALRLRVVIRVLDDLLLNAMVGNNISDLQHQGVLLYQSVDDVC